MGNNRYPCSFCAQETPFVLCDGFPLCPDCAAGSAIVDNHTPPRRIVQIARGLDFRDISGRFHVRARLSEDLLALELLRAERSRRRVAAKGGAR